MIYRHKTILLLVVVITITLLQSALSVWIPKNPFSNPITRLVPIPVACTKYGCVTSRQWFRQHSASLAFARATDQDDPPLDESLTTIIRMHMIQHALLGVTIWQADAERYRKDVLRLTDEDTMKKYTNLSAKEYDRQLLIPLLQQQALQTQLGKESPQDLHQYLSKRQIVFILQKDLVWDTDKARVVAE